MTVIEAPNIRSQPCRAPLMRRLAGRVAWRLSAVAMSVLVRLIELARRLDPPTDAPSRTQPAFEVWPARPVSEVERAHAAAILSASAEAHGYTVVPLDDLPKQ